jgi:mRNA-degrading endonuclease RelE of RelBE toxin-antitoxin system
MAYRVVFAASVADQLRVLSRRERVALLEAIEKRLTIQPLVETRNRKQLRPNLLAPWELRVGPLRAFYDVATDGTEVVQILAVGKKAHNRLLIGGQEFIL